MRAVLRIAAVCLALLVGGCGLGDSSAPQGQDVTMVLDFTPNAIHAGIYSALARTFDTGEGINLHVQAPSASTDSIKLLATGRADFAILDIHDLAIARAHGQDIVGIMAIVQRPLAAVIAAPAIRSPRQLEGKTAGITGVPSDTAVLDSIVAGAGAHPKKVKTITIGFNSVPALLAHRVDAATAFWNDEGITLQHKRPGFHVFRVDNYGAPSYPELVVCATRQTLKEQPGVARALVRTLVRGYGVTLTDPEGSAADLESQVHGLDPKLVAAQLAALGPAFLAPDGRFGELTLPALKAWAQWEARFGIVKSPPNVFQAFDPEFLRGTAGLVGN
jgi:ABC-type nitrate/sulfonate/bicarbonate transport system substrate-binding protein